MIPKKLLGIYAVTSNTGKAVTDSEKAGAKAKITFDKSAATRIAKGMDALLAAEIQKVDILQEQHGVKKNESSNRSTKP